jgi:hypothetical protein
MSTKEILQEQQKLASQLNPNLLQFIRSRRKGKDFYGIMDQTVRQPSDISELTSEASSSMKMDTDLLSKVSRDMGMSNSQHNVDISNICHSEDKIQISGAAVMTLGNDKQAQNSCLQNGSTSCQTDIEMSNIAVDLPIEPSEANEWLHMDVVEHEKLQWIGNIPPVPPVPPDTPYSARFDFQGRTIALYHILLKFSNC